MKSKGSKKSQTKKMSVYSMVPTLFILERPPPSKNNSKIYNAKPHPLSESYTPTDEEFPDRKLNKSSSIEDLLGDSEQTNYKLTITSNNDEISSSIGKIDGHLKRNCGLELTMKENKDELEINMKFATRCLISSLNVEFLTSIGKPKKLYTPRSAKSSREFQKGIIQEESEVDTNNILNGINEATIINSEIDESSLNNSLNSIDDRFKDKNYNKRYSQKTNNHNSTSTNDRVFIPLNDIKDNKDIINEEDEEALDTVGELKNDECQPFPSLSQNTAALEAKPLQDNSSENENPNKRTSTVNKTKPILENVSLQKKLGGRKGRRRSISSPPPPFPDLNTTINTSQNDDSDNDVLCHLRDIDVHISYMKGYTSYTPIITQVSRNLMNYDNKNAAMKDKEAKVLIYEYRIIGIADGINIRIKKILDPLSEETRFNLDPLKLIRIAGVNVYTSPQPKMVMPLMNMVTYLEINNHPKCDIIDAHILLGLALHSSHKSVQGIEIINKALDIIKYLLISGEIFKQSNMTFHSHLAQTPYTITSKSEIFLYTLARMAKLESLIAEMEYVRTRENESIPHFIEISRLWKYYLKAQDVDDKKRIDEIIVEIFKVPKETNPLLSRLSSPAEVIYNLHNLPDFFLFVLNDNRDPAIYFRSMSLSAIQFIIDTSGCSVGSEYSKICQHLFLNYSLWDDNQQLNDQSSDIDEGSNRKSIENTPLSMTFERGGWINQLFYVLESCYKLIPEFSNEVLREFIEEWAFPAAVALNRTQGAIIQLYRFLCSAFLNIEGYDILISNPFLDAVISDLIGNGTLSIAAGRFWAVLVEKTLTVIEKHNTGLILKYVTDRICQMLCDESSVIEGEICLLLDIICRIASKVKNIEDDPLKDEIACSFVTVSGVLLDTFEISIIDRYPDMFVTLWQTFRLSVEIIPQNFKNVVAQAIASVLSTFTKKLNDCAPTPKATKALYNILRYIQPDDQIISLAIELLPPFCRSIPHSIDSHQLDVLRELIIISSKAIKNRMIMEEMINALFDKFTVRSENFERTLRFLAALTMTRLTETKKLANGKSIWKFEWLEWVLEICLFENLIPDGIFSLDTVNDTKGLEVTHQLFVEKLKYLKSLISILKPYHVKLNFETINLESSFITRYNDIAGCCFLLLGHPDIHVICLAYEIMVGISTNIIKINSIRNYPNDNLLNVLEYYPAFLIKTLKRFLHDKEMVLSCLSAIIWMYQTLGEIELTDEEYTKIYPESLWDVCINVLKSPFRETSARSIDLISVIFNFIHLQLLSTRGWKGINIILLYLLNHGSWKRRLTGIKLLYILARRWPTYIHPHEDLIERTKEAHERVIVLQDDGRDAVRNAATHLFLMYNSSDISVISELLISPPDMSIISISMPPQFALPEIPSEDGIIKLALDYQDECKAPNEFNFCDHPKRIPSYFEIDLGYYQYVEPLDLVYECPEIDIASTPQTLKEFTEFPSDDFYINYIMEKNKLRWCILNEPQNTVEQIEYNTDEVDEFDEYTQ
ncbi:hypothetical protein BCR32DRAFT_297931 [Anaeromyces robustus]|uniref:Uncharacterized protein n=1 Tax=Anaeromyces robustus TaxID=1754192 RepID=A0A1Y1VUG5_9FUNG|nr:hypothetical protein BCR32DRAFT_297931 [Anaeromyces robustus]|eukprot:ORX64833.1 hypothetical protein BCR32DRAFT_297931 [Anaeromyces robustus]